MNVRKLIGRSLVLRLLLAAVLAAGLAPAVAPARATPLPHPTPRALWTRTSAASAPRGWSSPLATRAARQRL